MTGAQFQLVNEQRDPQQALGRIALFNEAGQPVDVGGGAAGVAWADVTGKPATYPPTIGTTASTAMAGNTPIPAAPTADTLSGATAVGRQVMTAADATAARTAIGAGTSSLALGATSSTAKAGNYTPTTAEVSNALKAKTQITALAAVDGAAELSVVVDAVNAVIAALKA